MVLIPATTIEVSCSSHTPLDKFPERSHLNILVRSSRISLIIIDTGQLVMIGSCALISVARHIPTVLMFTGGGAEQLEVLLLYSSFGHIIFDLLLYLFESTHVLIMSTVHSLLTPLLDHFWIQMRFDDLDVDGGSDG